MEKTIESFNYILDLSEDIYGDISVIREKLNVLERRLVSIDMIVSMNKKEVMLIIKERK